MIIHFQCEFCGKTFRSNGGLATHRIYCLKNPNKIKKIIYKKSSIIDLELKLKKRLIELNKLKNLKNKNYIDYRIENYQLFFNYKCEKCGNFFEVEKIIRNGRKIHCSNCKRKVIHKQNLDNINSIYDLSLRTHKKIIKRMDFGCYICGWKEASLDTHHIIYRSKNGGNECSNLIYVCPNCHRIIHTTNKYSEKYLKEVC